MAVQFTLDTTDKLQISNPHTLAAGSEFSICGWVRRSSGIGTSWDGGGIWCRGDGTLSSLAYFTNWLSNVPRDTTDALSVVPDANMWPGGNFVWHFMAITYSEASGIRIYVGQHGVVPAEVTYNATPTVGSGDTTANSTDFVIGNRNVSGSLALPVQVATTHYFSEELSLTQIIQQWHGSPLRDSSLMLFDLHGTGNQPDLSGNGNNATATGTAVFGQHAPIRPMFGMDPPVMSAVSAGGGGGPAIIPIAQAHNRRRR